MSLSLRPKWLRWLLAGALCVAPSLAMAQVAQEVTITGTVKDDGGRPLPNAQVLVSSLGVGTATRADGSYTLKLPAARAAGQVVTVQARLVGYRAASQAVTLSGTTATVDLVLAANPLQLGELVVTGAGTQSDVEKLGTVRNFVTGEQIANSGSNTVLNSLQAKAPGVVVSSTSGVPGASTAIQIRGQRSFYGTSSPLFVIDGVPVNNYTESTSNFDQVDGSGPLIGGDTQDRLSDINPDDIENVEILKGASASSVYGARGANGVIMITTKRGRAGSTRFTFSSTFGLSQVNRTLPIQTAFGQGRFGNPPAGGGEACTPTNAICFRSWGPSTEGVQTYDHWGELFENGSNFDNVLTVSGGNDRLSFLASAGYVTTNGMITGDNDAFNRFTGRLNAGYQIARTLRVTGNVQYSQTGGSFIQRGNNVSGILLGGLRTPPEFNNMPYLNEAGVQRAYRWPNGGPGTDRDSRGFDNPFFVINEFESQTNVNRTIAGLALDYTPLSWLRFNYNLGTDFSSDRRLEAQPLGNSSNPNGLVINGQYLANQLDQNIVGTATYTINQNFNGTVTLGNNLNQRQFNTNGIVGRDLIAPTPYVLSNTLSRDPPVDLITKVRLVGYFGQATFNMWNQLFLTGAIRYDGNSTFGSQYLWAWFPKGAAAWEFSKVTGTGKVLTYGKARIAYGEAGQEPLPYLTSTTLTSALFASGVQGVSLDPSQNGQAGIAASTVVGNDALKNERAKEFETGFDIGLFKDLMDVSFTYYNAKTSDVIINTPLPGSSGALVQPANLGTLQNQGYEVSLNIRPYTSADWTTQIGFNWARNRNEVLSLGQTLDDQYNDTPECVNDGRNCPFVELPGSYLVSQVMQKGQPFGVMRIEGFVRCGVTSPGYSAEFDAACVGQPKGAMFINESGFPEIDPEPRILADPNPNWTGGVNLSVRYKKITLSGLLNVFNGGQIWDGTRGALNSYGTAGETGVRATCTSGSNCTGNEKIFGQGGWFDGPVAGPGAGLAVPIGENWYRLGGGTTFADSNEPFIEDAGFTRLREVALQYTFDQPWVRKIGFTTIDLRVAGVNLATWTNYQGVDPETNLGQAQQSRRGIDYFNLPQARQWIFALNLTR